MLCRVILLIYAVIYYLYYICIITVEYRNSRTITENVEIDATIL